MLLLFVLVGELATSSNARAASPVDIYQAAQDVAAGTGTAAEVDEVQRAIDYIELEFGVSSSSVSYPTIEGTAASSDAGVQALQTATSTAPDGGSVEAAAGAELSTGAEELGIVGSEGGAIAGEAGDAMCLTTVACAAVAGGVVAAVVIGTVVVKIFDDGPAMDAASGSTQGTTNATAEAKVWMEPNGRCESWPGISGSWQRLYYYNPTDGKYELVNPYYNHTIDGANYVGQWTGSGRFNNNGDNYPGNPIAVPCGTPMPNGGLWVLQLKMPQVPSSAGGWAVTISSAWDENSRIPMSADCGNVFWTPPLPGGPGSASPWQRVTTMDNSSVPGGSNGITGTGLCAQYPNTTPMTQDTELSYETQTRARVGFPRQASCTTPQYVQCITDPTQPSSNWRSDAGSVANLFANGTLPELRQFIDSALGVTDPSTGQPYTEPGTVQVPNCSGLTESACNTALTDTGFTNVQIQTLTAPQAEWGTPAGDVAYTAPTVGTYADTASTVDEYANPNPMPDPTQTGESDDPSCDRSRPNYVVRSDQNPTGFTAVTDSALVQSSSFTTSLGPTVLNYGYAELINTDPLDFGGWGYWHVLAGHGWSKADDADTRTALEDPTPRLSTVPGATSSRYIFTGPKYPGSGGAQCRREVIVDFGTYPGDPGPKGIITSFGADVNKLPAGYQ